MRPLRFSPALGSFYSSRTQIGTILHSDLTVRHQFLGGNKHGPLEDYCDGNWTRNHQGIGNELIQPRERVDGQGRVRRRQRMGGVLNDYGRAAERPRDYDSVTGH